MTKYTVLVDNLRIKRKPVKVGSTLSDEDFPPHVNVGALVTGGCIKPAGNEPKPKAKEKE